MSPPFLTSSLVGGEVVSFTPRPLYPRGKSPRYPQDRLGGPQNRAGHCGIEKNILPPPGIVPVGIPTELSRFLKQNETIECPTYTPAPSLSKHSSWCKM
jgi:hypothetical protein